MPTLEINDIITPLGSAKIALSKSAYSFSDWLTKEVTRSKRVQIPQTAELDALFLRPKSPDISGKKFSRYYNFKYKDNGKIVFLGSAKLLEVSEKNQYEIQLLDKSIELFRNMRNSLNSVDFESSDFVFNSAAYTTLKVLNSSVWLWSAASMHEKKTLANNVLSGNLAFSRPFFSVKKLFDFIFAANGWLYTVSPNANLFEKLIISGNSEFLFTSYEKLYNTDIIVAGSQLIDLSSPLFLKTDSVSGIDTLNLNFTSKLRFRGTISSTSDMILQISGISSGAADTLTQEFIINQGDFSYDLTSNEFATSDATYDVQITLIGTGTATLDNFLIYTVIDENNFGNMSTAGFVDFKVKTYDNLPDIQQIDLFKHSLVSVSGFFNTDNLRKKITVETINTISRLSALDWSAKLNEDSIRVLRIKGYGKTNHYEYNNDKTKAANLGRGIFTIDNEVIPDLVTVYDSIFAASNEVEITDVQIDMDRYDNVERINDLNTIIGYYELITTYTVARFANLNGNTVFENSYKNFISAVRKGNIIQADFDINKSDFFLFDFTEMIYIEQLKSTFYVLSIEAFMDGRETELTLLKS